jgi:EAL domain-containing protein (putative c-di-GMP-specific phosphodiesterase class I)
MADDDGSDVAIGIVAGAAESRRGMAPGELMGQADLALARAEAAGAGSVSGAPQDGAAAGAARPGWTLLGEHRWSELLHAALREGRAQLAGYPVIDRERRLVHLECPLRLQLEPGGAYEVAGDWLPLAVRTRMTPDVDALAVALALRAIEGDARARCVNLSPASLADSGFAARLRTLLAAHARAARSLWLEIGESAAAERFELLRELARQVRPLGVRFGLEHAGERLGRIERLFEAGLDYVKLDASVVQGAGRDARRAEFARGLATLLHGLGLQVIAEGVADAEDAQSLWTCGVDAITGPWATAETPRQG